MEISDFSSGYYKARMLVVPYEAGPAIESETYDYINKQFYAQTDAPPLFRLGLDGNPYFQVNSEFSIPQDRMGIPSEWFGDNTMGDTYEKVDVFILKPGHAYLLNQADILAQRFNPEDLEQNDD